MEEVRNPVEPPSLAQLQRTNRAGSSPQTASLKAGTGSNVGMMRATRLLWS